MKLDGFNEKKMCRLILESPFSLREIARQVGVKHPTVHRRRKRLSALSVSWEDIESLNYEQLEELIFKKKGRDKTKRLPDFEKIIKELPKKGATYQVLWEDYYDIEPETAYGIDRFRELCREYQSKHDITMTIKRYPGEITNVDFAGLLIPYNNLRTRKKEYAHVFVAVLGVSNLLFVAICSSQKKSEWIDALNKMIVFYGGVTSVIVSDNLRAAIDKPKGRHLSDPHEYCHWT